MKSDHVEKIALALSNVANSPVNHKSLANRKRAFKQANRFFT